MKGRTMMIRERIQHIRYSSHHSKIVAAGREGGLYALDLDLNVVQTSPVTKYNFPICALDTNPRYIFTKDNFGNIARWDAASLKPIDYLTSVQHRDESLLTEDDIIIPSTNHALALYKDKLLVTNGYGQLLELSQEPFSLVNITDPLQDVHIETIETHKEGLLLFSDFRGFVTFADSETGEILHKVRIDHGPVHCVKYDARHDRFWATTDNRYSFFHLSLQGDITGQYAITNDDIEWIDFNTDASIAYLACFDHHLYIYANDNPEPALKQIIGPFKFQLKQVLHVDEDHTYVLLESGEIYRVNKDGVVDQQSNFTGNSVWSLDTHPSEDSIVYAALEDSSVAVLQYGVGPYESVNIKELRRHRYGFGRLRRAVPFPDSSFVAISTTGIVFKANSNGDIEWHTKILGICRDVGVSTDYSKIVVGTEAGIAVELDAGTGKLLQTFTIEHPVWAVDYTSSGQILIGARSKTIFIYDSQTGQQVHELNVKDNIKRFRRLDNGHILMNGPEGIVEFNPADWSIARDWREWVTTTVENAIVLNDFVHAVSYSYVLTTYEYETGEVVDNQITVPDFPKGLAGRTAENGKTLLLVAGRGAYVNVYQITEEGEPIKSRDFYL
jgi:WD40 repeat protein